MSNLLPQFLCESQEEFDRLKNITTKLRVILLERQNKNMFCKLSSFTKRDKEKFIKEISSMMNAMTEDEIDEEFNSICCDKLFECGANVDSLPVDPRGLTYPDHSILYNSVSDSVSDSDSQVSFEEEKAVC